MGDGVVYRVAVDGREVFTHALTAEQARRGWQPARVDLGEWAGETVRLTLATDPGPHGDGGGDWAGWGDVRVVTGDGVPWTWVRAAWQEGGVTAQDLIAAGEEARAAERWEESREWLERLVLMKGERIDTFSELDPEKLLVLESFTTANAWQPCPWSDNTSGDFSVQRGALRMSYSNNIGRRDFFSFISSLEITLDEDRIMLYRLKGEPGTLLTVEVVVDGARERIFNYRTVPHKWEVWEYPIGRGDLEQILIGVGEDEPSLAVQEYELLVDWIALK
jgi:hypothetical protein